MGWKISLPRFSATKPVPVFQKEKAPIDD